MAGNLLIGELFDGKPSQDFCGLGRCFAPGLGGDGGGLFCEAVG